MSPYTECKGVAAVNILGDDALDGFPFRHPVRSSHDVNAVLLSPH
jgi:hypothetical protein